jgi:hypothetical protein
MPYDYESIDNGSASGASPYEGFNIKYVPEKETPEQYQKRIAPFIHDAADGDPGEQYESEVLKNNGK